MKPKEYPLMDQSKHSPLTIVAEESVGFINHHQATLMLNASLGNEMKIL